MGCPDELTLDLWLAGALPAEEAAVVAAHARGCAACAAAEQAAAALGGAVRLSLALDPDERAYLSGRQLAAPWRARPDAAAASWGWIALVVVVGGYLAWLAAARLLGAVVPPAVQVGLGVAPLHLAVGALLRLGELLLGVARHPSLGLSPWLLALLALALLLWPRQTVQRRSTQA